MTILSDDELLAQVDAFLARTGMAPTRLGREVMGEASLVARMRDGRSLSLRNANKLLEFMEAHDIPPGDGNPFPNPPLGTVQRHPGPTDPKNADHHLMESVPSRKSSKSSTGSTNEPSSSSPASADSRPDRQAA